MRIKNKIRNSLKFSFLDGVFASLMSGLLNDYITPYALALKATTRQIGALTAVPFFVSSLAQFKSAEITEQLNSRKRAITIFTFLHGLMLVFIMLVPYLFKMQQVLFLIICITLLTVFGSLTGPANSSLMADYIPINSRGRYFGWRAKILSIIMIASSLVAGFILHSFEKNVFKGFLIIFGVAILSRFISWYFITQLYEPVLKIEKAAYFNFLDFIKRLKESNFGRFVLFVAGMQFAVNLASPFFSVLMLRELKFNYLIYTILVTSVTIANILTISRWGRSADRFGNVKVLKVTSLIIASLPLWWIINRGPLFLIFPQVLSGAAWAGFNLCAGNFVYDAVTPQKRIRCIAYLSVFVGMAVFLGGILGGQLVNILPALLGYKLLTLFLLSSTLRFAVALGLGGKIKEVRKTQEVNNAYLLCSVIGLKPISDINQKPE